LSISGSEAGFIPDFAKSPVSLEQTRICINENLSTPTHLHDTKKREGIFPNKRLNPSTHR